MFLLQYNTGGQNTYHQHRVSNPTRKRPLQCWFKCYKVEQHKSWCNALASLNSYKDSSCFFSADSLNRGGGLVVVVVERSLRMREIGVRSPRGRNIYHRPKDLALGLWTYLSDSYTSKRWATSRCECHISSEVTIINGFQCHIGYGTFKNPHCSISMSAEHRSKFAVLHR